jgi:hypothetical protein
MWAALDWHSSAPYQHIQLKFTQHIQLGSKRTAEALHTLARSDQTLCLLERHVWQQLKHGHGLNHSTSINRQRQA